MLRKVRLIQVFLAAPGDVVEEQGIVSRIINDWNISIGKSHSAHAELIQWKTHSHPEFGDRPQAIINRQALDDCDIVVGIFWSRFGTPTGHAQSGTEEEIRRSISSGKKVLLYFSDRLMSPSHINQEQYTRIVAFKQEFGDKGLFWTYSTLEQFERDFRTHISTVLTELVSKREVQRKQPRLRVAIGVIRKGHQVLMIRRRIPEGNLAWQFPAGIIKPNTSGKNTVVAETKKETGVTCRIVQFLGKRLHPDTKVESEYYLCEYLDGRATNRDKDENAEVKWVNVDRVSDYITSDLYEGIREALCKIQEEQE